MTARTGRPGRGDVGSVAEETARLLDALLGQAAPEQAAPEQAASSHSHSHGPDADGDESNGHESHSSEHHGPDIHGQESHGHESQGHESQGHESQGHESQDHDAHGCQAHGHEAGYDDPRPHGAAGGADRRVPVGDGSTCSLCPVCQLIGVARSVRPETVDRLADLAAALTQSLRDLALERWAQAASPSSGRSGAGPSSRHRAEVEDIALLDEGDDDAYVDPYIDPYRDPNADPYGDPDGDLHGDPAGREGDHPRRRPSDSPLPGLDHEPGLPS